MTQPSSCHPCSRRQTPRCACATHCVAYYAPSLCFYSYSSFPCPCSCPCSWHLCLCRARALDPSLSLDESPCLCFFSLHCPTCQFLKHVPSPPSALCCVLSLCLSQVCVQIPVPWRVPCPSPPSSVSPSPSHARADLSFHVTLHAAVRSFHVPSPSPSRCLQVCSGCCMTLHAAVRPFRVPSPSPSRYLHVCPGCCTTLHLSPGCYCLFPAHLSWGFPILNPLRALLLSTRLGLHFDFCPYPGLPRGLAHFLCSHACHVPFPFAFLVSLGCGLDHSATALWIARAALHWLHPRVVSWRVRPSLSGLVPVPSDSSGPEPLAARVGLRHHFRHPVGVQRHSLPVLCPSLLVLSSLPLNPSHVNPLSDPCPRLWSGRSVHPRAAIWYSQGPAPQSGRPPAGHPQRRPPSSCAPLLSWKTAQSGAGRRHRANGQLQPPPCRSPLAQAAPCRPSILYRLPASKGFEGFPNEFFH